MGKYIDRDRLLKVLEHNFCGIGGADVMRQLIEMQPAADAAPVVRCKDCKYGLYDSKQNGAMICLRTNNSFWRKETDFCSYGEYQTNTGGVTNE